MPFAANETDAQFHQVIHQLMNSQRWLERRDHQRAPFTSTQRIAPLREDKLPRGKDFLEVRCNDLTPTGFSFFVNEEPDFEQIVIAFEASSEIIYVRAAVRHSRKVLLFADSGRVETLDGPAICGEYYEAKQNPSKHEQGEPMFLVGCLFTGRFS